MKKSFQHFYGYWLVLLFLISSPILFAQGSVTLIGSFEADMPSYWTKGAEPGGSTLEWASDESFVMSRSLKITKEATAEAAMWTSENMCDNWGPKLNANEQFQLGAFIKTEGVNTSPANDDAKWMINYSYYNQSGGLIGTIPIEIDQSAASADWMELSDSVTLPEEAYTVIVELVGGKDATGTVWADAFKWPSSWNRTLELPTGFFNWFPWDGNNVSKGFENTRITTEEAHTGLHSLKYDLPFDRPQQDAFVASRRVEFDDGVSPGDIVRISVWIKAENLVPDSAAKYPDSWAFGLTPLTFAGAGNNDGYEVIWGPDLQFKFPAVTSFDWTEYYEDIEVPEAGAIEVRLHAYSRFTGKIYMDDLKIEKLEFPEISGIGSFEADMPSYWTKGAEPGGSTLEWASDESFVMSRSLKITKEATAEAAMWTSENMCDNWGPKLNANEQFQLGAFIKTEGVNTSPANDDAKWMINYSYYNQSGGLIGTIPIEIDQSAASADWMELSDSVTLPEEAYTVIVELVGGKDATGTVWADAFKWPSSWNRTLELPTGFFNWFPWDGNNVSKGFENTRITTEEAHTGLHSLKYDLPFDRPQQDAFVASRRVEFDDGVSPGDIVRISVWIKAENLVPDSAAKYPDSWAFGLTPLTFAGAGNNDGYEVIWGPDLQFKFPAVTSFDWTEYYEDIEVPEAGAIEVRLHAYSRFTGKIYMDDLKIEKLEFPEISGIGSFEADMPSYWTKGAEPGGSTLEWASDESFVMSRSLKITKEATAEAAMWTSENMCDNWGPKLNANEQFQLGAFIKTEGVNTSPANDDAKWMINYSYYNQSGGLIGTIPIEIDQSAASADWMELSDSVTLPEEAYTVIVELVGGKDATGTVWADAFKWPSSWNRTLELPTGFFNWFPWDGNNVSKGFENTRITTEEAHTGLHSLKYDLPFDRPQQDAFVASRRIWLDGSHTIPGRMAIESSTSSILAASPGDILRISVWIKAENLVPDSAAKYPDSWAIGLTPLTFAGAGNNDGYEVIWGPDLQFKFPAVTSFDWTEYYEDIELPDAKALEVRLHPYSRFTGKVYLDDLSFKVIKVTDLDEEISLPNSYELSQNYPNPFNPSTIISYAIPQTSFVTIKIYDMLGREVKTLYNAEQVAGVHQITWDARNDNGIKVSTGTYIYRIVTGSFTEAKKMLLLK